MRIINLKLEEDGRFSDSDINQEIGRQGEHNVVKILVTIPPILRSQTKFFKMYFECKDHHYETDVLIPTGDEVEYIVPNSVLALEGALKWQIVGYMPENQETEEGPDENISYAQVFKSMVATFYVRRSISGTTPVPEYIVEPMERIIGNAENATNAAQNIASTLQEKLTNGELVGEPGKNAYEYAVEGGYPESEEAFVQELSGIGQPGILVQDTEPTNPKVLMWADTSDGVETIVDPTNPIIGKKLLNLGDSLAAGDGNNYKGYAHLIADANNMILYSKAKGGATMVDYYTSSNRSWIMKQLNDAIGEGVEADYILFDGGVNDQGLSATLGSVSNGYSQSSFDPATFCGAFEAFILAARTAYPDAKLLYVLPHKLNRTALPPYMEAAKQICKKWSVPYVDLYDNGGLNCYISAHDKYFADGVHPNEAGYRRWYIRPITMKLQTI